MSLVTTWEHLYREVSGVVKQYNGIYPLSVSFPLFILSFSFSIKKINKGPSSGTLGKADTSLWVRTWVQFLRLTQEQCAQGELPKW